MRGKEHRVSGNGRVTRITPAYAGKSFDGNPKNIMKKDHPCVCGEKTHIGDYVPRTWGSPLRMRGKGKIALTLRSGIGITPAYAGKSV